MAMEDIAIEARYTYDVGINVGGVEDVERIVIIDLEECVTYVEIFSDFEHYRTNLLSCSMKERAASKYKEP